MTHPRWRSLARARGMSSALIRRVPRIVRATVDGVLPDVGWRTARLQRDPRRRPRVVVEVVGPVMAMVEACR